MREKILAQLVAKFPGVSKQFLGLVADKLAVKVTEEDKIPGSITELDNLPVSITDLASEFQKEGDRRVTEAAKKTKTPEPAKPNTGTDKTEPANSQANDDMPAWAKTLTEEIKSLRTEKVQSSMKTKLTEGLKDSKIPAKFYEKIPLPEKEEDLPAFIEGIKADYTEMKQELVNTGFSQQTPPVGGIPGSTGTKAIVEADIKGWASKGKDTLKTETVK